MRLTFHGAAGEVTGSCLLVETDDCRFIVDCGMFQGSREADEKNRQAYTRDLGKLDFVLLTHAHLDHCGLLPRFARERHPPTIYCTRPTADLVPVMLKDSAHIQERNHNGGRDARGRPHARRRTDRHRDEDSEALYTSDDVERLRMSLCGVPYDIEFRPHPRINVRFRSAGHIVGAAIAVIEIDEAGSTRRLVISGDIGEASPLLVRDRADIDRADVLVIESTYGDRNHRPLDATENELVEVLNDVLHVRHGNVIVPAFALGRTQEFLLLLHRLTNAGRIEPRLVFVDSPLARSASDVTFAHLESLDDAARAFVEAERRHRLPFALRYTETPEDSMFLNSIKSGAVIIAASGMCDAGRIRHHLRHNLGRRECGILFTGYQAAGTLGRRIVDGVHQVRLFGEDIAVRASVHTLGGLSAHAGQDGLMGWLSAFKRPPTHSFIVHGEPAAAATFEARIRSDLHWTPRIAAAETPYEI